MDRLVVALAALLVATGFAGAQAPTPEPVEDPVENPWLDGRPLNIAHAGGNHEAPGNTLFAVKNSTLSGSRPADGFEVDLHLTEDRHVVAIHDDTVDRTTDGNGSVSEMTLEEVKQLDAAYWWVPDEGHVHGKEESAYPYRGVATGDAEPPDGFTPEDFRIPTLREILENVTAEAGHGATPHMVLEIKSLSPEARPLAHRVSLLLHEFDRVDGTIVGSFNDASSTAAKALAPTVSTSPGLAQAGAWWAATQAGDGAPLPQHEAVQLPPEYQYDGTGPTFTTMTQDIVDDAHRNDLAVHVWTINDRGRMNTFLDMGVDGILTDRPTDLDEVLENRSVSS